MHGVLVCGTTGEAATLTDRERTGLIEAVRTGGVPELKPLLSRQRHTAALSRTA